MGKKYILIILIVFLCIFMASCQSYDIILEDSNNYPQINPISENSLEVILYYPNKEMEHLVPEIRVVSLSNEKTEEIAVNELLKGTEEKGLKSIIPKDTEILSLDIVEDIAYISFSSELLDKDYEEEEEAFIIYSIVNTLTNIPTINKVQILIDGKAVDRLSKHYSIREPLGFSDAIVDRDYISPVSVLNEYYNALLEKSYSRSIDMLDLDDLGNLKTNTLMAYLRNEFKGITQFDIKNYTIYEYGDKTKIDVEILFTYEKNNKKLSSKKVELISNKDKFLIKGLLY